MTDTRPIPTELAQAIAEEAERLHAAGYTQEAVETTLKFALRMGYFHRKQADNG